MPSCVDRESERRLRGAGRVLALVLIASVSGSAIAGAEGKRWNDAELVSGYAELKASGGLAAAIRSPARPDEPPQPAFLEALAWFAARSPDRSGTLPLADLDEFLDGQAEIYADLLAKRVEAGEDNDFSRTRTWKVIQKLMLLRDEMTRSPRDGGYPYAALPRASAEDDPWEREHTLGSPEALAAKICDRAADVPVLVKYGNTNCTQCMLFELTGSVKDYADRFAAREPIEVYKVWWGLRPDDTFTGRIRDPERLDELARAEGVHSSPYFIVYRGGRRYPCGDAFPDSTGAEPHLDECVAASRGEAPLASVCGGGAGEGR